MLNVVNPNIGKVGFGSRPREVDDEYRARAKGVPRERFWTKEKCCEELEDCLKALKKIVREEEKVESGGKKLKQECIRDINTMMNRVLEFMRYLYPPVQTNVNVNVDMTVNNVIERLKNWKKEQVVVIVGDVKEVDENGERKQEKEEEGEITRQEGQGI